MTLPLEIAIFSYKAYGGWREGEAIFYTKDFITFENRKKNTSLNLKSMMEFFGKRSWDISGASMEDAKVTFHREVKKCVLFNEINLPNDMKREIYKVYTTLGPTDCQSRYVGGN